MLCELLSNGLCLESSQVTDKTFRSSESFWMDLSRYGLNFSPISRQYKMATHPAVWRIFVSKLSLRNINADFHLRKKMKLQSSRMWHSVEGWEVPYLSNEHIAVLPKGRPRPFDPWKWMQYYRNFGNHSPSYVVSHLRRPEATIETLRKYQTSKLFWEFRFS